MFYVANENAVQFNKIQFNSDTVKLNWHDRGE